MTPTEPGFYFYFDGKDRYLVNVSRSCGSKTDEFDGPLMATDMRVDTRGYSIGLISDMDGEWSRKLELSKDGNFKDQEAQILFDLFVAKSGLK